ncbi:MAG: glycosyltransferase family 9 protein [Chlorobi bacterium]|nr:glycosyltransferase family 9 protein [Chlorobiota bacterium]
MKQIKKILAIRLSSLGDIILTTPVLRALKNKYSGAEIDFLLKKNYEDVLLHNPGVNRIFHFENLPNDFFETEYDLIVDCRIIYAVKRLGINSTRGNIFSENRAQKNFCSLILR